jgi:hypothetical protein
MKFLFLLGCFLPLFVFGQISPVSEFGVVSKEELLMKNYDKDTSALAVILFDVGDAQVSGRTTKARRHVRVKILDEQALSLGNNNISFYSWNTYFGKSAIIRSLKASTYNLVDGQVQESKLESNWTFKDVVTDELAAVKFALPNVRVGSVFELEYEIEFKSLLFIPPWQFQYHIPVKWSEYTAHVVEALNFSLNFQGYLAPVVNETRNEYCVGLSRKEAIEIGIPVGSEANFSQEMKSCKVKHWVMKDVPAFKSEPFVASEANYISAVKFNTISLDLPGWPPFTLISNWDDVRRKYFDKYVNSNNKIEGANFLSNITATVVKNLKTNDEKIKAIYQYVQSNFEWKGTYSSRPLKDLKKTFEEKSGSSGDLNFLLMAMLKHAEIQADPVLIRTRSMGFMTRELASVEQFNQVVVRVDYKGKKHLLDTTDPFLPMEYLTSNCMNGVGLMMTPTDWNWINLDNYLSKSLNSINVDVVLNEDKSLTGKVTGTKSGFESKIAREKLWKEGQDKYTNFVFKDKQADIKEAFIENEKAVNEPLKETYQVVIKDYAQKMDDVIYIDPVIFLKQRSNPLVANERKLPIDFDYPVESALMVRLKIPKEYQIEELPKPKMAVLPDGGGKFIYNVSPSDGLVTIYSQITLNKVSYASEDYAVLREFYNQIVAKHSEQIVLKKKVQ